MAASALIAAALAGLLGGLHCAAMCGGWLALTSQRSPTDGIPLLPATSIRAGNLASHTGRIVTYMLVGAALGAVGGAAYAIEWQNVQRTLYVGANVMLLALAFSMAYGSRASALESVGLAAYRRLLPAVRPLFARHGLTARFALGMVWGLTPCALVYGVLPVALLAGGAIEGGLVMLAFGLGTLPNLLVVGMALRRAGSIAPHGRSVAGGIVAIFAVVGLYRALFLPEALGRGPFCLFG
jgi:sulfite exporter TauE/SafE